MESAFESSFLNLKNNPSVKGKRLRIITRSYLRAYPNALNANIKSGNEILVIENVSPLNEKTIKITITDPPYDARVKSFFRELILARHI